MAEHPDRVREQLGALPEVPLPDALWPRVEALRNSKMSRRKWGASAATMAFVALMAIPLLRPMSVDIGVEGNESVIASRTAPALPDVQAEVRALDRALQAAYDRGASDAEIAPMWVARDALLANAGTSLAQPGT